MKNGTRKIIQIFQKPKNKVSYPKKDEKWLQSDEENGLLQKERRYYISDRRFLSKCAHEDRDIEQNTKNENYWHGMRQEY